MDDLEERILTLIAQGTKVTPKPATITPDLNLRSDLGFDSLGLVSLLTRFGEEIDVEPDELVETLAEAKLDTVADLLTIAHGLKRVA
jgi:acyl carrier protein